MVILKPQDLNTNIAIDWLDFKSTADLLTTNNALLINQHDWVAQNEAKKVAQFGLSIPQSGFNLLVLGAQGSGRTSLMQKAMKSISAQSTSALQDMVAICDFDSLNQPTLFKLPVGEGAKLRASMDAFVRDLIALFTHCITLNSHEAMLAHADTWLTKKIQALVDAYKHLNNDALNQYFKLVRDEVFAYLKAWQAPVNPEIDNPLDSLINEMFLARLRVNLLVDQRSFDLNGLNKAVVLDNDPSLQSLFGTIESATDTTGLPDFLKLRAGSIHRADGGMLMLHLRDLLSDEQNGQQILEKIHRFLRNGCIQIEDANNQAQSGVTFIAHTLIPLHVKLVLIATREDFYDCLDNQPDFFNYFPIKVEFAERILANQENYTAIACFVAQKSQQHQCQHFTAQAVAKLIGALQRLDEDQTRISTNFAYLEQLMLESVAFAKNALLVNEAHVQAAIQEKSNRNQYFETQIRDSIIDNELLIQIHGQVIGQVNGLTHIELGDASFGSPIRITARCYPGKTGLINIDREVNMSGPNHDKGIFILQNWLSASFWHLAPLSLNASLVFEQEYNGVEGDSASCAELFALLSALTKLPVKQGIAVTGALNQFGEVMPVGGINEKIEGYFRVCQALGLNGQQGVIIPKRNQRHLLLDQKVVDAVAQGQFRIIAIDHVLEGIAYLTDVVAGEQNANGCYLENTVMGYAQEALASYRKTLESNQPYLNPQINL